MRPILHSKPRYIYGRHIHHGAVGVILVAVGLFLAWDDWADLGSWFRG